MKDHVNMQFRQPYEQADYNFYHLIQHKIWHMNEYLEVLPFLEADALTSFFPRILSRVHVEGYAAGEITFRNSFIYYALQSMLYWWLTLSSLIVLFRRKHHRK